MKLSYIYSSRVGLKRTSNEDYVDIFEIEDGLLGVVCDGLGGNNAGEEASKLGVATIHDYFIEHQEEEFRERIENAVIIANRAIINAASQDSELRGMATTAEVLFIDKNSAYWGHVGDSRIYYLLENRLSQVTKDHSLVQKLLDNGHITQKEAENHPQKNIIMRALGDKLSVEVDTDVIQLEKMKRWKFLLCSDGVSNVFRQNELESLMKEDDLEKLSKALSATIEDRGAPDNYSYIIISNQITN
jgi:protein phosphatase